jgi:iron complex transport system permease protein
MTPRTITPVGYGTRLGLCLLVLVALLAISPGIGTQSFAPVGDEERVGPTAAWHAWWSGQTQSTAYAIAFKLRLPQALLAVIAGASLSLCGAVFQTLFRNPLTEPYTLGIASGGSLGTLIALKLGLAFTLIGLSSLTVFAFIGAGLVTLLVVALARGPNRLSTNELLLAGVTAGLFCSAMMMAVNHFSTASEVFDVLRWMMGSLETYDLRRVLAALPLLLPCWVVLLAQARGLNQYLLGDELAASRGVHVARMQGVCLLFCSLATAVVVSICGPIGFVGLVVPHIVRLLVGRDCRLLLPASTLLGGAFLLVCHWLSQVALGWAGALLDRRMGAVTLPIGVVTAIVGVPIFVILLRARTRQA